MNESLYPSSSIGRNIERIRKLKGIKQETLAADLGISRQLLSKLEQSEHIEDERLEQIAKALGVTMETIKNFSDDSINIHVENMNDNSGFNFNCDFNPIDKIVQLYEALLKSEREKNELLQSIIDSKSTSRNK